MANVLVVGGAGYLGGGYLVDASILGGHDLKILTSSSAKTRTSRK